MKQQSRGEQLAVRLEDATKAVVEVAKSCSRSQWDTYIPKEERKVGVLVYHIADATSIALKLALNVASGLTLPDVQQEDGDSMNKEQAEENSQVTKGEALALLEKNTETAMAELRKLTDEELDMTTLFTLPYLSERTRYDPEIFRLLDGDVISAQQQVEWNIINHRYDHLESIKEALGIE